MSTTFTNTVAQNIGTSPQIIYTSPSLTTSNILGFNISNHSGSSANVTVTMTNSGLATTVTLVPQYTLTANTNLNVISQIGKLFLNAGDYITVTSTVAASLDVEISVLLQA